MNKNLATFWAQLETNFPLGGARRRLRELLGDDVEAELERTGVLVHRRVATTYPCPRWTGAGCPRMVLQRTDGSAVASCGHATAQCPRLEMTAKDIEFLAVSPEALAAAVARALGFRVNFKRVSGISHAYRFGTFIPEPEVTHAIYFLGCSSQRGYGTSVDALRTHAAGWTLAILVPTDRFISENLRRQTTAAGIPLISLADTVGLRDEGGLGALVDPVRLFSEVGRGATAVAVSQPHVAHALVRERDGAPTWRRLDDAAYQRLVAAAASYDVFADELTKTVIRRRGQERIPNVPGGQFKRIRAALETRQYYDPGTGDDDGVAAKQLFQRARRVFDIKTDDGWSLFQTKLVDNHAVYSFAPRASATFAFVFVASPSDPPARAAVEDERAPIETLLSQPAARRPDL